MICMLDGTLNSVSLVEGMCDLINTIKPPFSLLYPAYVKYGNPLK